MFTHLLSTVWSAIQQAAWLLPWSAGMPRSPILQSCPASQAPFPTKGQVPSETKCSQLIAATLTDFEASMCLFL